MRSGRREHRGEHDHRTRGLDRTSLETGRHLHRLRDRRRASRQRARCTGSGWPDASGDQERGHLGLSCLPSRSRRPARPGDPEPRHASDPADRLGRPLVELTRRNDPPLPLSAADPGRYRLHPRQRPPASDAGATGTGRRFGSCCWTDRETLSRRDSYPWRSMRLGRRSKARWSCRRNRRSS